MHKLIPLILNLLFLYYSLPLSAQLADSLQVQAAQLMQADKPREAIPYYQKAWAQARQPGSRAAIGYALARAQLAINDPEGALQTLGQAAQLAQTADSPYYALRSKILLASSKAYAQQNDSPEAIAQAERAIALLLEQLPEADSLLLNAWHELMTHQHREGDFEQSLVTINEAIDYLLALKGDQAPELADVYTNAAVTYWQLGDYKEASHWGEEALRICLQYDALRESLGTYYNNLGLFCTSRYELREAMRYFKLATSAYEEYGGTSPSNLAIAYNNIATIYGNLGDYHSRYEYMSKVIQLLTDDLGRNHHYTATAHNNMAATCRQLKRYEEAMAHHREALSIRKEVLGKAHPDVAQSYHNISAVYRDLEQHERFYAYADTAQQIRQVYLPADHPAIAQGYMALALGARLLAQQEQEQQYMQQALTILQSRYTYHPLLAEAYLGIGSYRLATGDTVAAGDAYYQAIGALVQHYDPASKQLPQGKPISERSLLKVLQKVATIKEATAQHKKSAASWLEAWHYYELAAAMADTARYRVKNEASRQQLLQDALPVFEGALRVLWQLHQSDLTGDWAATAFSLAEKYKAGLLMESVGESRALRQAKLPAPTQQRLQQLSDALTQADQDWYSAVRKNDSLQIEETLEALFVHRQTYDQFQDSIQQAYPAFAELKRSWQGQVAPAEIAAQLHEEEAVLSYAFCERSLHRFTIDKAGLRWQKLPFGARTRSHLDEFLHQLQSGGEDFDTHERVAFASHGHALYQSLMDSLATKATRLIIIPDGKLGYLPFELLLTGSGAGSSFRQMPYLLRECQIHYAYSGSLWYYARKQLAIQTPVQLAAFAPVYTDSSMDRLASNADSPVDRLVRSGALPLPGAQMESRQITTMLSGEAWLGDQATEARFKEIGHRYGILHLSMHGLIDDQNPQYSKLIFAPDETEDGLLNAAELYHLPLQAQLVVLSACNTGYGTIKAGEGIMSLSRAFTYAGCPSTVMSLWKVPDAATSKIMILFYRGLRSGLSKDRALQQAKLDYLDQVEDPLATHPYYWAGFVQAGNATALTFRTTSRSYLWLVLVLCGLVGLTVWQQQRKAGAQ